MPGCSHGLGKGHSHGTGLSEDIGVDVHHQVTAGCILHDKADVCRSLEAGGQVHQEGVACLRRCFQDPLLAQQAVGVGLQRGGGASAQGKGTKRAGPQGWVPWERGICKEDGHNGG